MQQYRAAGIRTTYYLATRCLSPKLWGNLPCGRNIVCGILLALKISLCNCRALLLKFWEDDRIPFPRVLRWPSPADVCAEYFSSTLDAMWNSLGLKIVLSSSGFLAVARIDAQESNPGGNLWVAQACFKLRARRIVISVLLYRFSHRVTRVIEHFLLHLSAMK